MKKVLCYFWKIGIPLMLIGLGSACGCTRSHTFEYIPKYNSTQLLLQKTAYEVSQVKGVQHTLLLIQGNDLVICIKPQAGTSAQFLTHSIQQTIANQPQRLNVYVTAKPDFYHRLQNINSMATNNPNFSLIIRNLILDIKQSSGTL